MSRWLCMIILIVAALRINSLYTQPHVTAIVINYQQTPCFINPVLPGDHPDPGLTGNEASVKKVPKAIKPVLGKHDICLKLPQNNKRCVFYNSIQFVPSG